MTKSTGTPGVSRENRISDEGLSRLEKQLLLNSGVSDQVLSQWLKRYGEPAKVMLKKYNRYHEGLE